MLLEAAREAPKLRCFVQISTDEVYGSVPEGHEPETDELRPRNPYSASKAGADRLAYSYWATYDVPVIITRASNNYGPNQFPEKVIPLFITNAIDNIPVPLYGDGLNVRDWLHVDDHCRGIDLLIERGEAGEVYNIGGGNEVKNVDLTHRILELVGKPDVAHPAGRGSAGPRPPLLPRHDEAAGARLARRRSTFEQRAGRDRRVVPRERVVVAADQGTGRGVPRVLPGAVRQSRRRLRAWLASPLITGATGFAGGHLLDRLRRHAPRRARLGASPDRSAGCAPARRRTAVDLERSICSIATPCARRIDARAAVGRSITAPASPHVGDVLASARPRHLGVNVLGTHHLLEAASRRSACRAACWSSPVRAGLPPAAASRSTEDAPIGPASPYGCQQAGAGQLARGRARIACDVVWPGRSITPARGSRRASPPSAFAQQIAEIEAGRARAGAPRRQPRRAARHHRRPRHGARLRRDRWQRAGRGRPYNVCSGRAHTHAATCSTSCCRSRA